MIRLIALCVALLMWTSSPLVQIITWLAMFTVILVACDRATPEEGQP